VQTIQAFSPLACHDARSGQDWAFGEVPVGSTFKSSVACGRPTGELITAEDHQAARWPSSPEVMYPRGSVGQLGGDAEHLHPTG